MEESDTSSVRNVYDETSTLNAMLHDGSLGAKRECFTPRTNVPKKYIVPHLPEQAHGCLLHVYLPRRTLFFAFLVREGKQQWWHFVISYLG